MPIDYGTDYAGRSLAPKALADSLREEFCILVSDEEVQSDFAFQCEDCGAHNDDAAPMTKGWEAGYSRHCTECGKRYGIRAWTEETPP